MKRLTQLGLLLTALACCCAPAHAAITLDGTECQNVTTAQNTSCTGGTVNSGSVIAGCVGWANKTATISSVTAETGDTVTVYTTTTGSIGRFACFRVVLTSQCTTCTMTVNKSASVTTNIGWQGFAGVDNSTPVDNAGANHVQSAQASVGTGTDAVTSTAQTTVTDGDAVMGYTYQDGGSAPTISPGTSFIALGATFGAFEMRGEYLIKSPTGSQAVTFTATVVANKSYITGMIQLKPAAGGGATFTPQMMMTGAGD